MSKKEKRRGEGLESAWRQVDNARTDMREEYEYRTIDIRTDCGTCRKVSSIVSMPIFACSAEHLRLRRT